MSLVSVFTERAEIIPFFDLKSKNLKFSTESVSISLFVYYYNGIKTLCRYLDEIWRGAFIKPRMNLLTDVHDPEPDLWM